MTQTDTNRPTSTVSLSTQITCILQIGAKWKEQHCSVPKINIPPNHVCIHKSTAHQDAEIIWASQPCKQAFLCDSCSILAFPRLCPSRKIHSMENKNIGDCFKSENRFTPQWNRNIWAQFPCYFCHTHSRGKRTGGYNRCGGLWRGRWASFRLTTSQLHIREKMLPNISVIRFSSPNISV